jgi:hypothetical protein
MDAGNFVKVFDVLDSGFRDWWFAAFGLIFILIGTVVSAFPRLIKAIGIPYLNVRSKFRTFARYGFVGFAVLWTVLAFFATYAKHLRHERLARDNACRLVEGPVENFVPMPIGGHAEESFSVSGVTFKYSDFIVTDGFNNTSAYGGPINSDSYVRICYDPQGYIILRLEIRDFKSKLKDYAATGLFPKPSAVQQPPTDRPTFQAPWYSNLFLVFLVLDFVATRALFLPYLRTFFRLKTAAVIGCPLPAFVDPETRIRLRNSSIYWDQRARAIWLLPRGLNILQFPFVAAVFKVDPNSRSLAGYEIRHSSGFAFSIMIFLLTAGEFIFKAVSANDNAPSPWLFVGFAGLAFLILIPIHLRMCRSRMEKLVQDALSELKSGRYQGAAA